LPAASDGDLVASGGALHVPAEVVAELMRADGSGASRARTGDLQRATLALSQLSYGPRAAKCSFETVVVGPIEAAMLGPF
jgi:hypothetical protein